MKALFRRISTWGITPHTPAEEANYIRLTNVLLMFMFVGSIVETAACFVGGAIQAALLNSTAPFVFGGGLLLMRAGYTIAARLLVITVAYTAGHALATILGPDAQIQQIILFASALSFTFFPLNRWKYIIYGLSLPLTSFILLELTHYEPVFGFTRAQLSASQLLVIRIVSVFVIWLQVIGQVAYHIGARRRSQERLVSSAKMAALGQMAAGIGHEINNPLQLIVGQAQKLGIFAGEGPVPGDKALAIATRIEAITMRIGAIVRGLQALARDASADPFAELSVTSLINLTLDYCRARISSHGIELRVGPIPEDAKVFGREAQLSEVLLNVLNNALDATKARDERWIEIGARMNGGLVELLVTDSGAGISPEARKKLFEPFFTTKPAGKGTGLGLSISRNICEAHGGRIFYDGSSARTTFVIQLPRAPGGPARPSGADARRA